MDTYLRRSIGEQRVLCEEASARLGLAVASIEKDLWICWTLRELFALDGIGPHLTFKGGTSLSKGWKLIERFSEDLDVVINRDFLGFGGERAPEDAGSTTQREKRLEDLNSVCATFVRDRLLPALIDRIGQRVPKGLAWTLALDGDDEDGLTLLFAYPAAFAAGGYLRPVVRIELGARSDTEPSAEPQIQPYVAEALAGELPDAAFTLRTVAPERTFWEKAMLLHEETYRAAGTGPAARLARHYYDLWCLIRAGVADAAVGREGLFASVAAHRAIFFRRRREAQESLRQGSLRLLPAEEHHAAWKSDYEAMREAMFFGKTPEFAEILDVVGEFARRFNQR